jgi:hypothetical protein
MNLKIFNIKPLVGEIIPTEKPVFSTEAWTSMEFQPAYEKYINDSIGFHNLFVRSYNQVYYSLFKKANASDIVVGKEGYLFADKYIKEYLGLNFIGKKAINTKLAMAKYLQDTLKKLNIDFLLVFAPGKASFYPEYFPKKYDGVKKKMSNYDYYLQQSKLFGVNFLDLNGYYKQLKAKAKYPLYSKTGVHWTYYGMTYAYDSLKHGIELLMDTELPEMIISSTEITDTMRYNDDDIGQGLNLLFDLPTQTMAYPKVSFSKSKRENRINAVTVADSYYWMIVGNGMTDGLFKKNDFIYYKSYVYCYEDSALQEIKTIELNQLQKEIESQQLVMILMTEANDDDFGFGFIENLYDIYNKSKVKTWNAYKNNLIDRYNYYLGKINQDAGWKARIHAKARKRNIPYKEMMHLDAMYMVNEEISKK